jgi:hypothetical protein
LKNSSKYETENMSKKYGVKRCSSSDKNGEAS